MKTHVLALLVLLIPLLACVASVAAPATRPSPRSAERATLLKDRIKDFRLDLRYHGDEDKPYYRLGLSVQPVQVRRSSAFELHAQISEAQAAKQMDTLLGRLSGHRREWAQHAASPIDRLAARPATTRPG